MSATAWSVLLFSVVAALYTYALYPLLLLLIGALRRRDPTPTITTEHRPTVTVIVPAHNAEATIRTTLDSILALDYPGDRLQILVVSDGSTDRTDAIVSGYGIRGVELLRLSGRRGKTAAENAAAEVARGEILVNADASIRLAPKSLRLLVSAFGDAEVGVASGRDVSEVASRFRRPGRGANITEAGYVGYEMWVRDLETRAGGIIGSSGCFFAIRADLRSEPLPEELSWDFAAPMIARERGYRAVSVREAICFVPRTTSLVREYRRKTRTITRGMATLVYWRHLLNPVRHGLFAWKLFSHKVCRWTLPWLAVPLCVALALLAPSLPVLAGALGLAVSLAGAAIAGRFWPADRPLPRVLGVPAFLLAGNLAAMGAAIRVLRGTREAIWEPTNRTAAEA